MTLSIRILESRTQTFLVSVKHQTQNTDSVMRCSLIRIHYLTALPTWVGTSKHTQNCI